MKKKIKTFPHKISFRKKKKNSLEYARPARLALWLAAEVAIVGADVQEVVGSALALALLSRGALSLPAAVVVSAASSFVLLYVEKLGVRHLEALFALFIGTMVSLSCCGGGVGALFPSSSSFGQFLLFRCVRGFATRKRLKRKRKLSLPPNGGNIYKIPKGASFAALAAVSGAKPSDVAQGVFIPRLPKGELSTAVAIIGAVVMPHNLYLHSALVRAPPPSSSSSPSSSSPREEGEQEEEEEAIPEEAMLREAAAAAARAGGSRINTPRRRRSSTDATTAARASAPRAEAVAYFALESAFALSVALAINMCLVIAVAAGLDRKGGEVPSPSSPPSGSDLVNSPPTTQTLGLADAGTFLSSKYGPAAAVVWGVGLLAAGQSSTM